MARYSKHDTLEPPKLHETVNDMWCTSMHIKGHKNVIANNAHSGTLICNGGAYIEKDMIINGSLMVMGETSTQVTDQTVIESKNLFLSMPVDKDPRDEWADGSGIIVKGDTDKSILWSQAANIWCSTHNIQLPALGPAIMTGNQVLIDRIRISPTIKLSELSAVGNLTVGSIERGFGGIDNRGHGIITDSCRVINAVDAGRILAGAITVSGDIQCDGHVSGTFMGSLLGDVRGDVYGRVYGDVISRGFSEFSGALKFNTTEIHGLQHAQLDGCGMYTHAQIDEHLADRNNPHGITAQQVGVDEPKWNANRLMGLHVTHHRPTEGSILGFQGGQWRSCNFRHDMLEGRGRYTHEELDAHLTNNGNPHGVTADQVGRNQPQWNADRLLGCALARDRPMDGATLCYSGARNEWIPVCGIDHAKLANKGNHTHGQIDAHIENMSNPHRVTHFQVGSSLPQWNADKLVNMRLPQATQKPQTGDILVFDGSPGGGWTYNNLESIIHRYLVSRGK